MGASLHSMPHDFGRRAGFDRNRIHLFPQAVFILIGGWYGDHGARAWARCFRASHLLSGCHFPIRVGGRSGVARAETLKAGPKLASFLVSGALNPPGTESFPQRLVVLGPEQLVWSGAWAVIVHLGSEIWVLLMPCLCKHLYSLPLPCSDSTLGLSLICLSQLALFLDSAALALVLSCSSKYVRPVWTLGISRGTSCGGMVARRDQSCF